MVTCCELDCEHTSDEMPGVNVTDKRWRCRVCNAWRKRFHDVMKKQMSGEASAQISAYLEENANGKERLKAKFAHLRAKELPAALTTFMEEDLFCFVFVPPILAPLPQPRMQCRGFARHCELAEASPGHPGPDGVQ